MVNITDFGWHRTIITLLFAIAYNHLHHVYGTAAVAVAAKSNQHHQIIESPNFLSQSNVNINGLQPSRLRTLLINDLRNILVKNVCTHVIK